MHYNSPNLNGNGGRSTFCGRRFTLLTLWKYFSHSHIGIQICVKNSLLHWEDKYFCTNFEIMAFKALGWSCMTWCPARGTSSK